nr:MAG TPA: hypothetical protein [Caudoviricetes sp.]
MIYTECSKHKQVYNLILHKIYKWRCLYAKGKILF